MSLAKLHEAGVGIVRRFALVLLLLVLAAACEPELVYYNSACAPSGQTMVDTGETIVATGDPCAPEVRAHTPNRRPPQAPFQPTQSEVESDA